MSVPSTLKCSRSEEHTSELQSRTSISDAVWMPTVLSKHRERLIEHQAIIELFEQLLAIAREKDYLSGEHFSVDGTLIQAWAGQKRPPRSRSR